VWDASKPPRYKTGVPLSEQGRGGRWADGAAGFSLVNTVLPPNSPSCAVGGADAVDGVYSAGSVHPNVVLAVFADGHTQAITKNIDAGDPNKPPPSSEQLTAGALASPYGIWGALGTIAGWEKVGDF
jgi:hypothetical protein